MSSQAESTINHFSHPHPLHLSNHQNSLSSASCSGCKMKATGSIYGCSTCNYFLHVKCSKMPRQITHPSDHKDHILSLLPKPFYQEGFFNCDACGKQGDGFSYHCKACDTDLHILCAAMPLKFTHQSHKHQLKLIFSPPHASKIFNCDVCNTLGSNHWLYRCHDCDFDVHLNCVNKVQEAAPKQTNTNQNGQTTFDSWQNQTPIPQANHHFQDPGMTSRFAPQVPPQPPPLNYQPFNPQFSGAATGFPASNFMPNVIPGNGNQGFHPNNVIDPFLERQNAEYLMILQRLQALLANANYTNGLNQQQIQALFAGGGLGGGVGAFGGGVGGAGGFGGIQVPVIQAPQGVGGGRIGGAGGLGGIQPLIQGLSMLGNTIPGGLNILQGLLGGEGGLSILGGLDLGGLLGGFLGN